MKISRFFDKVQSPKKTFVLFCCFFFLKAHELSDIGEIQTSCSSVLKVIERRYHSRESNQVSLTFCHGSTLTENVTEVKIDFETN